VSDFPSLAVAAASTDYLKQARDWADRLSLPLMSETIPDPRACDRVPVLLYASEAGLALQQTGRGAPGPVVVEWLSGKADHRRRQGGGQGQLIARAVGVAKASRPLSVVDATAGLGQDAFVLATLGCQVTLLERSPVMAALLQDGLDRARAAEDADVDRILTRMSLCPGNAIEWLQARPQTVDVVYLDPMFPGRDKSSLVKKEMRVCRQVVGDDGDAPALLAAAMQAAIHRVVVKRPRKAPVVAGPEPDLQLTGKSSRYDLYTFKALP